MPARLVFGADEEDACLGREGAEAGSLHWVCDDSDLFAGVLRCTPPRSAIRTERYLCGELEASVYECVVERDGGWVPGMPLLGHAGDVTENPAESICGRRVDYEDVEDAVGEGAFVPAWIARTSQSVASIHWNTFAEPGVNVGNIRWCTGSQIGANLVLTAAHCFDNQNAQAGGWRVPAGVATPSEFCQQMHVDYGFQRARGGGNIRRQPDGHGGIRTAQCADIVEYNRALDYAVIRVVGADDVPVRPIEVDYDAGQPIALLQHPRGLPMQFDAGTVALESDDQSMLYGNLDTEGGSSGAGVLNADGAVIGVHVNGGCGVFAGANRAVPMVAICDAAESEALRALCAPIMLPAPICEPDATRVCYSGPDGTAGIGLCHDGEQTCVEDGSDWGACVGEHLPLDELCDGTDNDCDGIADEIGPPRTFTASEYDRNGHALWMPNLYPGERTHLHFADGARLFLRADGSGSLIGDAVVHSGGIEGEVWRVDLQLQLRGQGPDHGGPNLIGPAVPPPAVHDEWYYYDLVGGTVSHATLVATVSQRPADGRFPFQLGEAANSKTAGLGASVWFDWTLYDDGEALRSDIGDVNILLDAACGANCEDPRAEDCNGADDDCDGFIDEGVTNACGQCGDVPREICDDRDNDCDGATDEGVLNACGQCGDVPSEICDGVDDDCDGAIDEGVLNACGQCGDVPSEICDGADDDCDGSIDEGVLNACGQCGDVPPEVCDGADDDCDGSIDEGVLNACGQCGDVPPEQCNGADDDCDGSIDEGVANACGQCGAVPREICDGGDNDCDGDVDEGIGSVDRTFGQYQGRCCDNVRPSAEQPPFHVSRNPNSPTQAINWTFTVPAGAQARVRINGWAVTQGHNACDDDADAREVQAFERGWVNLRNLDTGRVMPFLRTNDCNGEAETCRACDFDDTRQVGPGRWRVFLQHSGEGGGSQSFKVPELRVRVDCG